MDSLPKTKYVSVRHVTGFSYGTSFLFLVVQIIVVLYHMMLSVSLDASHNFGFIFFKYDLLYF